MGLFKALFGKPNKKRKTNTTIVSKPVEQVYTYRLYKGHYEDPYDLPSPKEGQGELFFSGDYNSSAYVHCPLSVKGLRKGQRLRVEVIPQDAEIFQPDGESKWKSDYYNDPVVAYEGVPFGGLRKPLLVFKSLARKGYKVYLDARYMGMRDTVERLPEIEVRVPDPDELEYWAACLEIFGEYIPFDDYSDSLFSFTSSGKAWGFPDEITGNGADKFSIEYVVPEKKTQKPRVEITYKDCVIAKYYESSPKFKTWYELMSKKLKYAGFKRCEGQPEEGGYYWRVYFLFED